MKWGQSYVMGSALIKWVASRVPLYKMGSKKSFHTASIPSHLIGPIEPGILLRWKWQTSGE